MNSAWPPLLVTVSFIIRPVAAAHKSDTQMAITGSGSIHLAGEETALGSMMRSSHRFPARRRHELLSQHVATTNQGFWLGVGLHVFGQFLGAISFLLMKRAAIHEARLPFYRRTTFQVAFSLFIFNSVILDAIIYALVPLAIIAPITALGLVFVNIGVAHGIFVPNQQISAKGVFANVLIVFGIVLASSCGPHSNSTPTIEMMYARARSPSFLCYALPGLGVATSCCVALWRRMLPAGSLTKTVWCASAAAIFGSLSVLCFKGVATVVRLAIEGNNELHDLRTWLLLLGAMAFAPANVTLMNLTIEESDAALGMPLYQALILLATIISGGLFYGEFGNWVSQVLAGNESWLNIAGFVSGILIVVVGIVLLTTSASSTSGGEHDAYNVLMDAPGADANSTTDNRDCDIVDKHCSLGSFGAKTVLAS
eukprot:TRINITY_DN90784_c0_g1_i1.p1 TRINITY_DN90784_c0_g1~~TRINITY_DN90784_c0_g1_i1.p1  ORF type:complete len:425 (-),score=46.59 TRINITY_DN90784_c0_g1_i1:248-1522(-)